MQNSFLLKVDQVGMRFTPYITLKPYVSFSINSEHV